MNSKEELAALDKDIVHDLQYEEYLKTGVPVIGTEEWERMNKESAGAFVSAL